MWEKIEDWDTSLLIFLNGLGHQNRDAFWLGVTQIETWIPLYIFIVVLIFKTFPKKSAWVATIGYILSFLISIGCTQLIKVLVARPRPSQEPGLQTVIRILQNPGDYSFVSGHSAVSFALATYTVLILRHQYRWVYVVYLWPVLFTYSRIYVGVHYPLDSIVGAFLGGCLSYGVYRFVKERL